jgi:hypothetical protein
LRQNAYIDVLSEVRDGLLPLFWVEECGDLTETDLRRIVTEVTRPLQGYHVIQWVVIGSGIVVILFSLGYLTLVWKKAV